MPIRQLAPDVAAKIAAGEVVERPASVVKELIENSIDAGASQIRVELMNGGLQLIRVSDNGQGIPADELPLALARHATSKVAVIDDLEQIHSLGFRGEALASIAAVADVTLLSHHQDAEHGAQIHAHNGEISGISAAALPVGTSLTVRNLFSAVPARLKFLKSRSTEVSHCLHLLEQYALAYPAIRFSVFSEGRQLLATPGDGQLNSVLIEIHGLGVAEQMVAISSLDGQDDDDPLRPVVTGYTSLPACYKSTRQHISFFVNRRWVLSRTLTYAVEEAYHSLLLPGRHPLAVVHVEIDPSQIDVNVHPAKTEIRFLKERRVYAAVLRAVRAAVMTEATAPTWGGQQARATQLPRQAAQAMRLPPPAEAATDDAELELPLPLEDHEETDQADAPNSSADESPWLTVTEEETGTKPPVGRLWQSHVHLPDHTTHHTKLRLELTPAEHEEISSRMAEPVHPVASSAPVASEQNAQATPLSTMQPSSPASPAQQPLLAAQAQSQGNLPALRVIGQYAQSYIVTEGQDGLYLIDQHAAHERILLEQMVAALQNRASLSQLLLNPLTLKLSPLELEAIEEHLAQLEYIGFALEIVDTSVVVNAVPQVLLKQINASSLQGILRELTAPEDQGFAETWEERALANVACKAAIKANYFLTISEMREMLTQLAETKAPFSCCHGRPTTVRFSLAALEREFGRR